MVRTLTAALVAIAAIAGSSARADVIFSWETLSATVNGVPNSDLGAIGQITLSDAAVDNGFASVTTTNYGGHTNQTLDGVVSASFQMTGLSGLFAGEEAIGSPLAVINFTATLDRQFLDITPDNSYGGFFVDAMDTNAYYATVSESILTIGFGSDNPNSICYGPQQPATSHCVITGVFENEAGEMHTAISPHVHAVVAAVPEPGTLALLLPFVLGAFGLARRPMPARRRAVRS